MYESLNKIFYKHSNEEYENIYKQRIENIATTILDFEYLNNSIFFIETKDINKSIYNIISWNTKIISLINELPTIAIDQFKMKCLIDEIIQTNNIEGVRSTRREVKDVIEKPEDKTKRFHGIVQKYLKLSISELDIKNVNDIRKLFDDIVSIEIQKDNPKNILDGKIFRKESVSVYTANQREIHKGVYPETKIIKSLKKAINILNNLDINPLIRISIFHYLFGYIHPFYDGNGRVSRFISSYYFSKELNSLVGYRLSYTIKEHLKEYYGSFEECNNKNNRGEVTHFIEMFLKILEQSMFNLYEALNERKNMRDYYTKMLIDIKSMKVKQKDVCNLLIQAELFSDNGITLEELSSHLSLDPKTIALRLKKLDDFDIIKKDTTRKPYYYGINLEKFAKLE